MNIKQAKEEIKNTVLAYLLRDETGEYQIPIIRQRPILLIGPPGIGKTQIMEQIARECKIALVSYTMTHHTRQSAVGLPFIKQEEYGGKEFSVTEYTMSEIIASVYRKMKETGISQGILFLDEINCVSETLAPAMLQFLQCKTFGNQEIPKGWVIVAAGNPPEYNKSVKEFDLVTLDRIRHISLKEDYSVWREYARERGIHPAILGYLELRPKNFYRIEADVEGMQYVTARGWEDFSSLLYAYDLLELPVGEEIVYEYLHHRDVAEDVAAYVDLYRKYEEDYGIQDILQGKVKAKVYARMERAAFDERLTVVNLLLDGLLQQFLKFQDEKNLTDAYYDFLKKYRSGLGAMEEKDSPEVLLPGELYGNLTKEWEDAYRQEEQAGLHTAKESFLHKKLCEMIKSHAPLPSTQGKKAAFEEAKAGFDSQREVLRAVKESVGEALECAFDFGEEVFLKGEEMGVFVTELTVSKPAAGFLLEYECKRYQAYARELLAGTEKGELLRELSR
ncbi:MAG: AAA family ATPase [Lachnospiraceae bacterium]|nr:AAA family ATPase [Lachnospiraceae bacterium]